MVATTGLSTEGRSRPASFHLAMAASPTPAAGRAWLLTARMMRSGRSRWGISRGTVYSTDWKSRRDARWRPLVFESVE